MGSSYVTNPVEFLIDGAEEPRHLDGGVVTHHLQCPCAVFAAAPRKHGLAHDNGCPGISTRRCIHAPGVSMPSGSEIMGRAFGQAKYAQEILSGWCRRRDDFFLFLAEVFQTPLHSQSQGAITNFHLVRELEWSLRAQILRTAAIRLLVFAQPSGHIRSDACIQAPVPRSYEINMPNLHQANTSKVA